MLVKAYNKVEAEEVSEGVGIRWVLTEKDGADNFLMRIVTINSNAPQNLMPMHKHPYEHEIFILEGKGVLVSESEEHPIQTGDVVFIPPNESHQIRPLSDLSFI